MTSCVDHPLSHAAIHTAYPRTDRWTMSKALTHHRKPGQVPLRADGRLPQPSCVLMVIPWHAHGPAPGRWWSFLESQAR